MSIKIDFDYWFGDHVKTKGTKRKISATENEEDSANEDTISHSRKKIKCSDIGKETIDHKRNTSQSKEIRDSIGY